MPLKISTYWAAKYGNRDEEYEDAFASLSLATYCNAATHNVAVADGATESAFSQQWAKLLVTLYRDCQLWSTVEGGVVLDEERLRQESFHLAQQWSRDVFSRALPWYAVEKAQKGAFSSLLGLTIQEASPGMNQGASWVALAIGDSCLFHLRNGDVIAKWPIQESEQFGYHPLLLSTDPTKNETLWTQIGSCIANGVWEYGDICLLMTDALAHWFMRSYEAQHQPWLALGAVCTSQADFREWLHQLRSEQKIRNDDVTLTIVEIVPEVGSTFG